MWFFIKFTMAFADNLFVLATSIWNSEEKTQRFCLVLLFSLRVAQDVQESENASILQELHQVLITEEYQKGSLTPILHNKFGFIDDFTVFYPTHWLDAERKIPIAFNWGPKNVPNIYLNILVKEAASADYHHPRAGKKAYSPTRKIFQPQFSYMYAVKFMEKSRKNNYWQLGLHSSSST